MGITFLGSPSASEAWGGGVAMAQVNVGGQVSREGGALPSPCCALLSPGECGNEEDMAWRIGETGRSTSQAVEIIQRLL